MLNHLIPQPKILMRPNCEPEIFGDYPNKVERKKKTSTFGPLGLTIIYGSSNPNSSI